VVPACCTEGCEVEPDGTCEHGCPSPLIALGIIWKSIQKVGGKP
jgi:hypothetical protein